MTHMRALALLLLGLLLISVAIATPVPEDPDVGLNMTQLVEKRLVPVGKADQACRAWGNRIYQTLGTVESKTKCFAICDMIITIEGTRSIHIK
jgi:hypothetical protein